MVNFHIGFWGMINQKEDSGVVISIIIFRQQTAQDQFNPSTKLTICLLWTQSLWYICLFWPQWSLMTLTSASVCYEYNSIPWSLAPSSLIRAVTNMPKHWLCYCFLWDIIINSTPQWPYRTMISSLGIVRKKTHLNIRVFWYLQVSTNKVAAPAFQVFLQMMSKQKPHNYLIVIMW